VQQQSHWPVRSSNIRNKYSSNARPIASGHSGDHVSIAQDIFNFLNIINSLIKINNKMGLLDGLNRKYALFSGLALGILWFLVVIDREYRFRPYVTGNLRPPNSYTATEKDVFNFAPVEIQALKDICSRQEWNSSLIFTCDNNHGGVGHVRNSILNCVRYAIGAGGSFVLPMIALRDKMDTMGMDMRRHGPGRKGMEYMFDKQHFKDSLRLSCPELKLIDHMEQTANGRRRGLLPESLFENRPTSGLEDPEEWPERLHAWVDRYMVTSPQREPIVVDLEQSLLEYPTHSDGHAMAHTFGGILKFREDARQLATEVLRKMSDWYDLELNLTDPILKHSFFGAHLRTEPEELLVGRHVTAAPYMHFEAQSQSYLEHASASRAKIMYVASGNLSEIYRLSSLAPSYNVEVTHKFDLLKGTDRDKLEKLKWDQRALVDYLVLLRADEFAGVGHSSFSWNVALKRHELTSRHDVFEDGEWGDGLSRLYGVRKSYVESSGCMWP
jgi:hypothetical protein